jgi:hypothetical protein
MPTARSRELLAQAQAQAQAQARARARARAQKKFVRYRESFPALPRLAEKKRRPRSQKRRDRTSRS